MMFTTTGPRWLCQGNWAPGCTVYLTSTVRDGSSTWTTIVPPSCSLSLNFMSISSGKTERAVSGSAAIGGGGSLRCRRDDVDGCGGREHQEHGPEDEHGPLVPPASH